MNAQIPEATLVGKQFGRLTVISPHPTEKGTGRWWDCNCTCGNSCVRPTRVLQDRAYSNKSCGCAKADSCRNASKIAAVKRTKFVHPLKKKLKDMRGNMIKRCYVPTARRYERYGGRGITVCDLWRNDPTAFYKWAIENGFREGLSIDRINANGNYEPSNVRFVDAYMQANNTNKNVFLEFEGKRLTIAQWAREKNLTPQAVQHRIERGWSTEEIITTPLRA